jgi:hypothetical protein
MCENTFSEEADWANGVEEGRGAGDTLRKRQERKDKSLNTLPLAP